MLCTDFPLGQISSSTMLESSGTDPLPESVMKIGVSDTDIFSGHFMAELACGQTGW